MAGQPRGAFPQTALRSDPRWSDHGTVNERPQGCDRFGRELASGCGNAFAEGILGCAPRPARSRYCRAVPGVWEREQLRPPRVSRCRRGRPDTAGRRLVRGGCAPMQPSRPKRHTDHGGGHPRMPLHFLVLIGSEPSCSRRIASGTAILLTLFASPAWWRLRASASDQPRARARSQAISAPLSGGLYVRDGSLASTAAARACTLAEAPGAPRRRLCSSAGSSSIAWDEYRNTRLRPWALAR